MGGICIIAGLISLVFASIIIAEVRRQRRIAEWALPTLDPPFYKWQPNGLYSCFLSHYKMETASDARYLSDLLRKMLRCPCFLDSSTLADLRLLFDHGLLKSDVLVILASRGYLTRPWCLLEILEAYRHAKPMLMVEILSSGWELDEARDFVEKLEEALPTSNSNAMGTLESYMGTSELDELKAALTHMLDVTCARAVLWNPSARDTQVIASARDICDRMAEAAGRPIHWSDNRTAGQVPAEAAASPMAPSLSAPSTTECSQQRHGRLSSCAAVVSYERGAMFADARVIQSELSIGLRRPVFAGERGEAIAEIDKGIGEDGEASTALVLLLSQGVLADQDAMAEVYHAIQLHRLVVPVYVHSRGYNYAEARNAILEFNASWMRQTCSSPETGKEISAALIDVITNTIAVDWRPDGGYNQTAAAIEEITARIAAFFKTRRLSRKGSWKSHQLKMSQLPVTRRLPTTAPVKGKGGGQNDQTPHMTSRV